MIMQNLLYRCTASLTSVDSLSVNSTQKVSPVSLLPHFAHEFVDTKYLCVIFLKIQRRISLVYFFKIHLIAFLLNAQLPSRRR